MAAKTFSITESLSYGWDSFVANAQFFLITALFPFIINLILGFLDNKEDSNLVITLIKIGLSLAGAYVGLGLIKVYLKYHDHKKAEYDDIKSSAEQFMRFIAGSFLYGILVLLGVLLLLIPGIYFALKYQFVPTLIADKNEGIKAAFKESSKLTQGVKWKLLGYDLLVGIISLIGLAFFGILTLVTTPVIGLASVYVYRHLHKHHTS